jgi:hypothetical protein
MVERGVMTLTGEATPGDAWAALIPYQAGDSVAIKVNLNNCYSCDGADDNEMDSYSETVNAVIDGLVSIGVPPDRIWITDPSRTIGNRFRNRITTAGVRYYSVEAYSNCNDPNYFITEYVPIDSSDTSPISNPPDEQVRPARVLVDADHLINIPLMKGHGPPGWYTLALKNHYGSVYFKNHNRAEMHDYIYPGSSNYDPSRNPLGDISNNPHIRNKTRLIIGDSLYGHPETNGGVPPIRWKTLNNDSPNMLFFGVDPIASESVMLDWMNEESIQQGNSAKIHHDELHYADEILGLGVHEHWTSFADRAYSTIDYMELDLDQETCQGNCFPLPCDQYLDCLNANGSCLGGYSCCSGTCGKKVCADADGDQHSTYDQTFCPYGNDCNDNDADVYPAANELCDGKDNDCDGTIDEGYQIPQKTTGLAFQADKETMIWDAQVQADRYDVVKGGITLLRSSLGDFTYSLISCLEDDKHDLWATDPMNPETGDGFYYLVRAQTDCKSGTFNTELPGQQGDRDPEIEVTVHDCFFPNAISELRFEKDKHAMGWNVEVETDRYDIVKGNLIALRSSNGDFFVSLSFCQENDSPDRKTVDYTEPLSGQGFYYLVRAQESSKSGTYNTGQPSQQGDRDSEVDASSNKCP